MKAMILTLIKYRFMLVFIAIGCMQSLSAQQSVHTSGSEATGSGGQVSYSVGQIAYTTLVGADGSVAQGVQQTYDVEPVSIEDVTLGVRLKVFPNPNTDYLVLQIDAPQPSDSWTYTMMDMQGRVCLQGSTQSGETMLSTGSLPTGQYILQVMPVGLKTIKTFSIVKIK
jgi:hypothetical protein